MPFNIQNQTFLAKKRPVYEGAEWERAADWVSITSVPDEEMYFLVSNIEPFYRINVGRFSGSGDCYVDWGDGTVDTFTSASTAIQHDYTSATGGTACTRGYDTWKVRVYADSGTVLRHAFFNVSTEYNRSSQPSGLLEAWYGDDIEFAATSMDGIFYSQTNYPTFNFLEFIKLPASMPNITTMSNSFRASTGIRKIVMPTSASSNTSMANTFNGCTNLIEVVLPQDMTGITTFVSTFSTCNSLLRVTLPPTLNSVTTMANVFNTAISLKQVVFPASLPACTTLQSAFQNCYCLTYFEIPALPTTGNNTLTSMFSGCFSLETVKFPRAANNVDIASAFTNCYNLKYVLFPKEMGGCILSLSNTFTNCISLKTVTFPSVDDAGVTLYSQPVNTMAGAFSGCQNLEEIKLFGTTSATTSFADTFFSCIALSEVIIPNSYNISSLATTFSSCRSLKRIVLPNNAQNSIGTMLNMCLNCNSLTTIEMPTSMTGLTSLATAFSGCSVLNSVTFPSALNSVTTMLNTFLNCSSLRSVTMPTSMSALTNLNLTFSACSSLKTLTLPATVSASLTTMASCFVNCTSLSTVTLPTTQTTSLNSMISMFSGCSQLRTINNQTNLGNTATGGTICDATTMATTAEEFPGTIDLNPRLSKIGVNGSVTFRSKLTGLRLRNTGSGQWGGTNPVIDVSYTDMSTSALNTLFADLAAKPNVTSKTINITAATGAAGLSAGDRLVITSKGWTITG